MANLSAAAFQQCPSEVLRKTEDLSINVENDEAEHDAGTARKAQAFDAMREAESIEARNVENARKLNLEVDANTAALDRHRIESTRKAHAAAVVNLKDKSSAHGDSRAIHESCVSYLNSLAINRNRRK